MSPSLEIGCASSGLAEASRVTGQEGCRRLNPLETPGWDELVLTLPGASFFHSASWAVVLRDTYGHRPHYVCAMNGERLVATLPVMEVNSPLTGRRGVSLPFTDECLCLSDNPLTEQELFVEAMDFGRKRGWKYLECRGTKNLSEKS